MRLGAAVLLLALMRGATAFAQDTIIATANADRLDGGNGGGASLLWLHPSGNDTVMAGGTFMSLPGTRWGYATLGATRRMTARTTLNAEANAGSGNDDRGGFHYILLRGGITRELLARRLYAEAEWLQVDVARQQDGIARIGAAFMPDARLAMRASVFQSLYGDNDTTLATLRADYDLGRFSVIAGLSGGTATPALLQQAGGDATRVREVFGGVVFGGWTIVATAGEERQRVSVSRRISLGIR